MHAETGLDLAETWVADVSAAEALVAAHRRVPRHESTGAVLQLGKCHLAAEPLPAIRARACGNPLDSAHAVQDYSPDSQDFDIKY